MRIRLDEFVGPLSTFRAEHVIKRHFTQFGFNRNVRKLRKLIEKDMKNMDAFIGKWHAMFKPNLVELDGEVIQER
ncbi:MAG: hypothetical protein AAFV80_22245 [Bacteroidota bacterium]